MASRQYQPDRSGLAQVARSRAMGKAMETAAGRGRRYAETTAPRRTGTYAASFEVVPVPDARYGRSQERRSGAALVNTADYALAVERRHRVLSHAVDAIEKDLGW